MASLIKTPAGRWKAVIRKTGWPTLSKTFRTKRDAMDWSRRTEDEMVRGVYVDRTGAERMTLETALTRYLSEVSPTKRPGSAKRDHTSADAIGPKLGAYTLVALTPDVIASYRDERLSEGKAADTVRIELNLLSHLFNTAIREWRVGLLYNPVTNVRKPSPGAGRNRRLIGDEEARLLAACAAHTNPMLGWLVKAALYTGMRAGEIQTLRRDQVDVTRRIVTLEQTKNGSARTVPLSIPATRLFLDVLNNPLQPDDTDLLFWGEPGRDGHRRPYEFRPAWKSALRRADISGLRFHDLRHEAVSRLVEAGLGDQEVASISGHKSMQMLRRYTHLRAEDLVHRLDELLG
ncbi:MAG: site-specific integrase [Pseudomonadota bacterium]